MLSIRRDTLFSLRYNYILAYAYCHFPRWYGPSHLFTNGMTLLMAIVLPWLSPFSKSTWYNPSVFLTATLWFCPRKFSQQGTWYSPDSHFLFKYYNLYADRQPNLHVPSDLLPSLYSLRSYFPQLGIFQPSLAARLWQSLLRSTSPPQAGTFFCSGCWFSWSLRPPTKITPACPELPHEERGVTLKQTY